MAKRRRKLPAKRPLGNHRRTRISLAEVLSQASRRAHEQANRPSGRREMKSVWAAIAASHGEEYSDTLGGSKLWLRWLLAAVLLPFCWVTTWTFLSRFSDATVERGFWQTKEFLCFSGGVLIMLLGFGFRRIQVPLLYIYVLGHELTHALFVILFFGKVTDFSAKTTGGYITTNKSNLIIALSPYFVPFWSVVIALSYGLLRHFVVLGPWWEPGFYVWIGLTWTFHMVWTIWMLPRDQPDLKEHGRFFSLVIIYLANLLLLVALLCVAADSPWQDSRGFAMDWLRYAATSADAVWRWCLQAVSDFRSTGKF